MKNLQEDSQKTLPEYFLDITADTCPMTFVRTKLLMEQMGSGEVAEVRLSGSEPIKNVPRSIAQHGHRVLSMETEGLSTESRTVFRLLFQKQ